VKVSLTTTQQVKAQQTTAFSARSNQENSNKYVKSNKKNKP
jgi:hypothetical protein